MTSSGLWPGEGRPSWRIRATCNWTIVKGSSTTSVRPTIRRTCRTPGSPPTRCVHFQLHPNERSHWLNQIEGLRCGEHSWPNSPHPSRHAPLRLEAGRWSAIDARTTRHTGYRISQLEPEPRGTALRSGRRPVKSLRISSGIAQANRPRGPAYQRRCTSALYHLVLGCGRLRRQSRLQNPPDSRVAGRFLTRVPSAYNSAHRQSVGRYSHVASRTVRLAQEGQSAC